MPKQHGKGVIVVVSIDDLKKLEMLEDAADVKAAKRARKQRGEVPLERIKKEMGLSRTGKARKSSRPGK